MGTGEREKGTELVKVRHETRSKRMRRQRWLRAGIWGFLFVFAVSVVGGLLLGVVAGNAGGH